MLTFDIDDGDEVNDDLALMPSKHSAQQQSCTMLKFDIDDDGDGDDGPVPMLVPAQRDAAPMLKFDIDNDEDEDDGPVPMLVSARRGATPMLNFDIDVDGGDNRTTPMPISGRQPERQGSQALLKSNSQQGDDLNDAFGDAIPGHDSSQRGQKQLVISVPVMGFDIEDSEDDTGAGKRAADQVNEHLHAGRGMNLEPTLYVCGMSCPQKNANTLHIATSPI